MRGGRFGKRLRPPSYARHVEAATDVVNWGGKAGVAPRRYTHTHACGKRSLSRACQSFIWGEQSGKRAVMEGNRGPCSPSGPVPGENQVSGLAGPSPCCRDVSQLLPSAFPSRMSNSAVITFNESWGLLQLHI